MTAAASPFERLCQEVTQRFVRTAILIDDQIVTPSSEDTPPADAILEPPPFLAQGDEKAAAMQTVIPAAKAADAAPAAAEARPEPVVDSAASTVAIKPLADAFLDRQIICAVLNPVIDDGEDDIITRAVNAASFADVVIIDWYLRQGNAELTLNSLTRLLAADKLRNGRKRLIIVYTSAAPLDERRAELKARIEEQNLDCVEIDSAFPALRSNSSRIIFVEKKSASGGATVAELPGIALSEFAKEAEGLMPIFALSAIARIREATHHMLSVFKPELDPALVGHRMVLLEPSDAREFALETLLLQLKGVLTSDASLDAVLDKSTVGAWFDHRFPKAMEADLTAKTVARDEFKAAVEDANPKSKNLANAKIKAFHKALYMPEPPDISVSEENGSCELARLSTHVREAEGATPLPTNWLPSLTLGSIVRTEGQGNGSRFLLCTQPLCDTLRLEGPEFFSFVALESGAAGDKNDYWVVARADGAEHKLKASRKRAGRHFAKFAPDANRMKIVAIADPDNARRFTFIDEGGVTYRWIADIDRLKAQRAAEEMASALGRVGVDEFEWLRMGGKIAL